MRIGEWINVGRSLRSYFIGKYEDRGKVDGHKISFGSLLGDGMASLKAKSSAGI